MNIFEDVQFEDLKGEQREIAELIGFDNYLKLVEKYDGEPIPIPKASSLLRPERNRAIYREWLSGASPGELAKKYNLTKPAIYWILNRGGA